MQSVDSADWGCSCGDLFAVTACDSDPCYELTFAEEVENGKQIAADVLAERNVPVLPDILANAGGVIVSYLEWAQNTQEYPWTLEEVNGDLERRLTAAFEKLIDAYSEYETPDLRTAAYIIALDRNATAHAHRGLFP